MKIKRFFFASICRKRKNLRVVNQSIFFKCCPVDHVCDFEKFKLLLKIEQSLCTITLSFCPTMRESIQKYLAEVFAYLELFSENIFLINC